MRDGFIGAAWAVLLIFVAFAVTAGDVRGAVTAPVPVAVAATPAGAPTPSDYPQTPPPPTATPAPSLASNVRGTYSHASHLTPVPTSMPAATPAPEPTPVPSPVITVETVVLDGLAYHVADIRLFAPEQFQSGFAGGKYSKNAREHLSDMAISYDALFAINADYYAFRSDGIIIREGVLYRNIPSNKDLLCIMEDGSFQIRDERGQDGAALLAEGVRNTFSFGPALVKDGQAFPLPKKYFISMHAKEPRTAIGQIDALHYVAIVVDGRAPGWSGGISLSGLAELFVSYNCVTAYNLDGGGSATMFFDGGVVNRVSGGGQRSVSDMIYVPNASEGM